MTTTYVRPVPVTVVERDTRTTKRMKGAGCLRGLSILEILLGLLIVALEAACVGMYYFYEASAVGIWVGIFAIIAGIVGLVAGRAWDSDSARRCCLAADIIFAILLALKAFALFAASAAFLAVSVGCYYEIRNQQNVFAGMNTAFGLNGQTQNSCNNYFWFLTQKNSAYGNSYSSPIGPYIPPALYGHNLNQTLNNTIGLKATLMILYFLLFVIACISSIVSCVNCCRRSRKERVVLTSNAHVYPNGQSTVVQHQHKV
ncbi:hypothetical protein RvY_18670 [Ramazzottius varieornatus]|uniref:MARVEL domain-containing protein n=1 Tax=Ramazzottius varieornatus TaxID=947166 RepID=A0A1D1W6M4_RAMVA|nr:hypothetical protein RvY_18670 [Ramazzottius varieornatus]